MASSLPIEGALRVFNNSLKDAAIIPTLSCEDHFQAGMTALDLNRYAEAAHHFRIIAVNFPNTPEESKSHFFLGVCMFQLKEYDWANDAFTTHIKHPVNPEYFEEAVHYKYNIAEKLRAGEKRRPYGSKHLPKWISGQGLALEIYDEIIAAMPIAHIAAQALFSKAMLQKEMGDYHDAIESLQTIIKRFPKNELSPEAYVMINVIYLAQACVEFQNPDILSFSEINLKRFQRDYPGEPRIKECESNLRAIKEVYAKGLFDTGQFYERLKQPHASILYYQKALTEFPETTVATECRSRLTVLNPSLVSEPEEEKEPTDEDFERLNDMEVPELETLSTLTRVHAL